MLKKVSIFVAVNSNGETFGCDDREECARQYLEIYGSKWPWQIHEVVAEIPVPTQLKIQGQVQ